MELWNTKGEIGDRMPPREQEGWFEYMHYLLRVVAKLGERMRIRENDAKRERQ